MHKYEVYKINLVYICFTAIAVVNIYNIQVSWIALCRASNFISFAMKAT